MDAAPSPSPPEAHQIVCLANSAAEENTITNICASNIILDVPDMTTRSRTEVNRTSAQSITEIIIPKHILQGGGQVVTVLPAGVRTLQPTLVVAGASRQPPPLQQMQHAPPPPRLQQMAPAPPPLQAKPREGSATPGVTSTLPPPLQIKIVLTSIQGQDALPIMIPAAANASSTVTSSAPVVSVQLVNSETAGAPDEDVVTEVLPSEEDDMEVNGSFGPHGKSLCLRAGCNNPAVDSEDWDKEYCSNECVATHCRDVFKAWCSIRNQSMAVVK